MKLNWFTPLPPAPTRIARWMTHLLPSLSARAEVVLWTDAAVAPGMSVEVRHFDPDAVPWAEVHAADLSIYHFADDPAYGGIWEISRRHPGLVLLHDSALPRLFAGHFRRQPDGEFAYRAAMGRYYGDAGRWLATRIWDDRVPVDFLTDRCPHTELAVEGALGVLVHSQTAYDALGPEAPWPIAYLPVWCDAELYVDGLLRLVEEARRYGPRAAGYCLAGRAAAVMSPWAGPLGEGIGERVAELIVNFV